MAQTGFWAPKFWVLRLERHHTLLSYHDLEDINMDFVLTRGSVAIHASDSKQNFWPAEAVIKVLQLWLHFTKINLCPVFVIVRQPLGIVSQ